VGALAINGGEPVSSGPWPPWPRADAGTIAAAERALLLPRWSVSGPSLGGPSLEQRFGEEFARWNGTRFAVATDHGSSSLVVALEALGVGAGDEVIVPVLTWVATAAAVVAVNAVPVFADVDPATGCLDPGAAEAAIGERTRAILPVHLHCSMADLDALLELSRKHGLPLIEDCAQAHGARWRGRAAGSLGDAGAFSMQHSKVLTAGEGGAVVTDDAQVYDRLQQLRADSRRYDGGGDIVFAGDVMGTNHCLSEVQAAILLDRLAHLDAEIDQRERSAGMLERELVRVPGVEPVRVPAQVDRRGIYEYALRVERREFAGRTAARIADALASELGFAVYPTDAPLHRNPAYCPWTKRRHALSRDYLSRLRPCGSFPVADRLHDELVVFHHSVLLAEETQLERIAEAFAKVQRHAGEL
jgi:L-glutamine:2-deoxy-scyllo-inosose/3-amino-2,3-dideoxy-scyllo-inosose aminotransferase